MNSKKRVALIVPNRDLYSETFIKAHKQFINAKIFYYYGGLMPTHLEGHGKLSVQSRLFRFIDRVLSRLSTVPYPEFCFKRSLRKNHIDVVLAEYGMTGATVMNICKKLNIPLLVHFHGLDASVHSVLQKYAQKYVEMFLYAKRIFVVSTLMKNKMIELGCPPEKLILNIYGPHYSFFDVNPDFRSNNFIAVGRFVDKKAPYYTILTFSKVVKVHSDARLVMVGDGELLETCKNLVRYLNIESNVIFNGVVDRDGIQQLMRTSIGFLQHSIIAADGNSEGTPVGIIEASAAGLPVISTYHAGIPDVIINDKTGFLVAEHDVDEMAEKIMALIRDKTLAQAMGKKGQQRIKEQFNLKQHIDSIQNEI